MSELMDYALKMESEGKYQDALNYLEMVLEEKGCPFDIRKDFGRVLNKMGQYEQALNNFDLVLSMDEQHAECWFGKGISNIALGNWIDAYNNFVRSINYGDEKNANNWYYIAVIGDSISQVNKETVLNHFNKFKKLDNKKFAEIRNCYKFGLLFDFHKNKLFKRKKINIDGFKNELNAYDLSDDQIDSYLKTLSYEHLIEKIKSLKVIKHENDTKLVLSKELGLSIEEINDLLSLTSIEDFKKEVTNPDVEYPILDTNVNIPLYVLTPFEENIYKNRTDDFKLLRNISSNNTFVNVLKPMGSSEYVRRILGHQSIKINYRSYERSKRTANYNFNNARKELSIGNYRDAQRHLEQAIRYCPNEYYNRVNILFYHATFYSLIYHDFTLKKIAYEEYRDLEPRLSYFINKDVFLLNMASITYDLSYQDPSFIDESISYFNKYLQYHPDSEEVKYLIKTLQVYKSRILNNKE